MTPPAQLDTPTLRDRLADGDRPLLVDVRTAAEFETAHIDGALHVPLDLLRAHPDRLAEKIGPDAVLVCRSGQRAEQAAAVLAGAGVTGARVLAGGIVGWEAAGGPVNRGRQTWELDRQVRFTAGLLVLLGVLGSLLVPGLQWFAALIGAALVVTALLGICPMASALSAMPWNRGTAPVRLDQVTDRLARAR